MAPSSPRRRTSCGEPTARASSPSMMVGSGSSRPLSTGTPSVWAGTFARPATAMLRSRRRIGVGRTDWLGPPSLRTVRAVLPHTALQLVVLPSRGLHCERPGFEHGEKPQRLEVSVWPALMVRAYFACYLREVQWTERASEMARATDTEPAACTSLGHAVRFVSAGCCAAENGPTCRCGRMPSCCCA